MSLRPYLKGLLFVLSTLVVSGAGIAPLQVADEPSRSHAPSLADTSLTLFDLDGDNRIDQATLDVGRGQPSIELQLSRTGQVTVLQLGTTSGPHGSLIGQDIDGDGDIDLIWQGGLQPQDLIIWLGDGTGQFERLYPRESRARGLSLKASWLNAFRRRSLKCALSPERSPEPGRLLTRRDDLHLPTYRQTYQPEQIGILSSSQPLPSNRGPPFLPC